MDNPDSYKFHSGGLDIYTQLESQLNEAFDIEDETIDANDGLEGSAYRKELVSQYLKDNKKVIYVWITYIVVSIMDLFLLYDYFVGLMRLNTSSVPHNFLFYIIPIIMVFSGWIYSTQIEFWSFHSRKMLSLLFCILTAAIALLDILFLFFGGIWITTIATLLTPTLSVTLDMIKNLCRILIFLSTFLFPSILFGWICKVVRTDEMLRADIIMFDISQQLDLRSRDNIEFSYDITIVRKLDDGTKFTIKEKDRYIHALANGTTGTGKTSSTFTCAIESDIEQISHNLEYQKREIERLLKSGKVRMKTPMEDKDFYIDNFEPVPQKESDLWIEKNKKNSEKGIKGMFSKKPSSSSNVVEDIKVKARTAGIIAMAPNASFSDEIYALAKAKGLSVNRLDPTLGTNGKLKESFKGFNPLYISTPRTDLLEWTTAVNQKATLFADVAQAVYDASGQSDVYFASLNKNITTTLTTLVLLCAPFMKEFEHRHPTPEDVQKIINDFGKAEQYLKIMKEHYAKKDPATGAIYNPTHPDLGQFQPIYDVVANDILGEGRKQLYDQCRGLRNIINSFLGNPMIKNILCSQNSIDFDRMLDRGEITLVNYALELGVSSTVFGLFFLLSMIDAAYRRKGNENTRTPCFIYIDEFPVLLHPRVESCFTLFRQYKMAMFVAIQSLSQVEKSAATAYLKPVLLGNCAHHFVFGRSSIEEMKLYQDLAGTSLGYVEQEGVTETSMLSDNPSVSYNKRKTVQRNNNIEGSDIRYRKFQEVTVVSVRDGTPVASFTGKMSFLPRYKRIKKKRYSVDWNDFYKHSEVIDEPTSNEKSTNGKNINSNSSIVRKELSHNVSKNIEIPVYDNSVKINETPLFMARKEPAEPISPGNTSVFLADSVDKNKNDYKNLEEGKILDNSVIPKGTSDDTQEDETFTLETNNVLNNDISTSLASFNTEIDTTINEEPPVQSMIDEDSFTIEFTDYEQPARPINTNANISKNIDSEQEFNGEIVSLIEENENSELLDNDSSTITEGEPYIPDEDDLPDISVMPNDEELPDISVIPSDEELPDISVMLDENDINYSVMPSDEELPDINEHLDVEEIHVHSMDISENIPPMPPEIINDKNINKGKKEKKSSFNHEEKKKSIEYDIESSLSSSGKATTLPQKSTPNKSKKKKSSNDPYENIEIVDSKNLFNIMNLSTKDDK